MKVARYGMALIVFLLVLNGCRRDSSSANSSFEKEIQARIGRCLDKNRCVISLEASRPFHWDEAFQFGSNITKRDREGVVGQTLKNYRDGLRQNVFLNAGRIVHEENEPTHIEHAIAGQVDFPRRQEYPDYARFTPTQQFSVRPYLIEGGGEFFILTPVH